MQKKLAVETGYEASNGIHVATCTCIIMYKQTWFLPCPQGQDGSSHFLVQAKLAVLAKQFKQAEAILLERVRRLQHPEWHAHRKVHYTCTVASFPGSPCFSYCKQQKLCGDLGTSLHVLYSGKYSWGNILHIQPCTTKFGNCLHEYNTLVALALVL